MFPKLLRTTYKVEKGDSAFFFFLRYAQQKSAFFETLLFKISTAVHTNLGVLFTDTQPHGPIGAKFHRLRASSCKLCF